MNILSFRLNPVPSVTVNETTLLTARPIASVAIPRAREINQTYMITTTQLPI